MRPRLVSMCGRFALYTPPERLARQFDAGLAPDLGEAGEPHWNIPPTQGVLAMVHPRRKGAELYKEAELHKEAELQKRSGVAQRSRVTKTTGVI